MAQLTIKGYKEETKKAIGLYNSDDFLWPYKGGDSYAGSGFPAYKCLFPLPPTELATNKSLVQNSGY